MTTASKLDKKKIVFITKYTQSASGCMISDAEVVAKINKKRQDMKRKSSTL
ncbi:hypothetical protein Bhyg_13826, partial [Pseudolycoriella hygida]